LAAKVKEKTMANKKLWLGMLVLVLVFGMTVVGCDDSDSGNGGGGDPDTWTNVTSLSQLNGTWKGSFSLSETEQGVTIKMTQEMTVTITATNATTGTMSGTQKMTITYSGTGVNENWSEIKQGATSEGWTVDDTNHSMSITDTIDSQSISMSEMDGVQINQNNTKFKLPAGVMEEGSPEIIFIKQ
jgi:hypothetical protein